MKNNFLKRNSRGFTLVETLVAISIFTVSILGLLAVLTQGMVNTSYAKQKIVASYLAQEGIEYIRNLRDTMVLYPDSGSSPAVRWSSFRNRLTAAAASCNGASGCYFNDSAVSFTDPTIPMTDLQLLSCGSNCPELKYDSTTDKYGYATGSASGYTRQIKAVLVNANEVRIISKVSWVHTGKTYNITFAESLFNWAE